MLALRRNMEPESSRRCAGKRGDLAIPFELDHGSRRSLQGQLFEQSRRLALGWRLKPGYGCPGQPGVCRVTQYLPQQRVARPRSSDRGGLSPSSQGDCGTYVSLELPETCLVTPAGPSPRRLHRASLPPWPLVPIYRVGTGSGEHGQSLIVLPRQTKKTASSRCSGSRSAPVKLTRDRLSVRFLTQENPFHRSPCHLMYGERGPEGLTSCRVRGAAGISGYAARSVGLCW
jgi:hypothetical protein